MTRTQRAILRAAYAFVVARDRYFDIDDEIGDAFGHPRVSVLERARKRSERAEERFVQLVRDNPWVGK